MKRGEIGHYETTRIAGESVRAFVPHSQNWIGGTRPGNARFVLPPPNAVPDCMAALERFIHAEGDNIHPLIRAALTHLQFEPVPPFLDGNGRTCRQKSDTMAVMSGRSNQSANPPAEHLLQAAPEHLLQPAIPCAPDRRLGSMAAVLF